MEVLSWEGLDKNGDGMISKDEWNKAQMQQAQTYAYQCSGLCYRARGVGMTCIEH